MRNTRLLGSGYHTRCRLYTREKGTIISYDPNYKVFYAKDIVSFSVRAYEVDGIQQQRFGGTLRTKDLEANDVKATDKIELDGETFIILSVTVNDFNEQKGISQRPQAIIDLEVIR